MKTELEEKDLKLIIEEIVKNIKPILESSRPTISEDFYSPEELAQILKVKISWLYQKVHHGNIPCYRLEGHLRFKKSEIGEWLTKRAKNNKNLLEKC